MDPFVSQLHSRTVVFYHVVRILERGIESAKPLSIYDSMDLLLYSIFTSGFFGTSGFLVEIISISCTE